MRLSVLQREQILKVQNGFHLLTIFSANHHAQPLLFSPIFSTSNSTSFHLCDLTITRVCLTDELILYLVVDFFVYVNCTSRILFLLDSTGRGFSIDRFMASRHWQLDITAAWVYFLFHSANTALPATANCLHYFWITVTLPPASRIDSSTAWSNYRWIKKQFCSLLEVLFWLNFNMSITNRYQ